MHFLQYSFLRSATRSPWSPLDYHTLQIWFPCRSSLPFRLGYWKSLAWRRCHAPWRWQSICSRWFGRCAWFGSHGCRTCAWLCWVLRNACACFCAFWHEIVWRTAAQCQSFAFPARRFGCTGRWPRPVCCETCHRRWGILYHAARQAKWSGWTSSRGRSRRVQVALAFLKCLTL